MKSALWFAFVLGIALPAPLAAQNTPVPTLVPNAAHAAVPAKDAHIVGFSNTPDGKRSLPGSSGPGPLHILYSDGTNVEIPKERGRFDDVDGPLPQEGFKNVQVAEDRRHIGWMAEYMVCAQSYPCSPELTIYQSGREPIHLQASHGVVWNWRFVRRGKQVVVEGGFPHGDEGDSVRYETDTGRQLSK